jgi:hypothetical protein
MRRSQRIRGYQRMMMGTTRNTGTPYGARDMGVARALSHRPRAGAVINTNTT